MNKLKSWISVHPAENLLNCARIALGRGIDPWSVQSAQKPALSS